jgi:RNA polymerase sigma factor (sigma-70 family)
MKNKSDEFIPTRASLLNRLKDWKDQESWQEFFSIYRELIYSTALKSGLSEQEAEDVVQETVISVAKTVKEFKYDRNRCSFKSWLRHLTRKRIADRFRKRPRERPLSEIQASETADTLLLEQVPSPESLDLDAVWEEEWRQKLLNAATERVKNQVSPSQYQMFDFYVLRKMPVKEVATLLGASTGQVYLAKHRISRLIKKEAKYLETRMG